MESAENFIAKDLDLESSISNLQSQADTYFGGFVGRYIAGKLKCSECLVGISTIEIQQHHIYTQFREFDDTNRLVYVKEDFSHYCGSVVRFILGKIGNVAHHSNLDSELKSLILDQMSHDFRGCSRHELEFSEEVLTFLIFMSLRWFSKDLNAKTKEDEGKATQKKARFIKILGVRRNLVRKSLSIIRRKAAATKR